MGNETVVRPVIRVVVGNAVEAASHVPWWKRALSSLGLRNLSNAELQRMSLERGAGVGTGLIRQGFGFAANHPTFTAGAALTTTAAVIFRDEIVQQAAARLPGHHLAMVDSSGALLPALQQAYPDNRNYTIVGYTPGENGVVWDITIRGADGSTQSLYPLGPLPPPQFPSIPEGTSQEAAMGIVQQFVTQNAPHFGRIRVTNRDGTSVTLPTEVGRQLSERPQGADDPFDSFIKWIKNTFNKAVAWVKETFTGTRPPATPQVTATPNPATGPTGNTNPPAAQPVIFNGVPSFPNGAPPRPTQPAPGPAPTRP